MRGTNKVNVRALNGIRCKGDLSLRYKRLENRAAAVLDAWIQNEDEPSSFDIIAHLHQVSMSRINADFYGDLSELQKKFGKKPTVKLEKALQRCRRDMKKGVHEALAALANGVPFVLLKSFDNGGDAKPVIEAFLNTIIEKTKISEKESTTLTPDEPSSVRFSSNLRNLSLF
jgi:hypothetical protein